MGIFLRKSFGAGPLRFNISKSGLGISTGVKGLRVGVGPRGVGISGGRKGIYFRKTLSSGGRASSPASPDFVKISGRDATKPPRQESYAVQFARGDKPLKPGGYVLAITLGLLGMLTVLSAFLRGASLPVNSSSVIGSLVAAAIWFALAGLAYWRKSVKIKRYAIHESNLARLAPTEDKRLLQELRASVAVLKRTDWDFRHRYIYTQLFDSALEDGIDEPEMAWLREASKVLSVNSHPIHYAEIKERLWESMADGSVTETEEAAIEELLATCGVGWDALKSERFALKQIIAARPVQEGNLPTIEAGTNLQRNEVCHHQTTGSILEKRVLRTYTVDGEKQKEEGLVVTKEGTIFVTSKRVLIVGEGTSSIPHDKILDLEIDPDENVISITKDGRQKPLFLRVEDLIYTGILLEAISTKASKEA